MIEGQAPGFAVFLGSRSKTDGPKVGLLDEDRALPSRRPDLVLRSWPAFGGFLFTDSDEGEKRVIESRDTVFSPLQLEPATGGG